MTGVWWSPFSGMSNVVVRPLERSRSPLKSSSSRDLTMNNITDTGVNLVVRSGGWRRRLFAIWEPTRQRPFTFIMRENPWLLIIPAISITLSVRSLTPLTNWWRAGPMYFALGVECCARARVLAGSASLNNANLVRLSRSVSLRHFR